MEPAWMTCQALVQPVHHWLGERVKLNKRSCQVWFSGKGDCK